MKILYLSFTCDDIGVAMVTNIISQLLSLFLLYNFNIFVTRHFVIGDHFALAVSKMNIKKVVFYVGISSVAIK